MSELQHGTDLELTPEQKFIRKVKRMALKWANYFRDTQTHWAYRPTREHYLTPLETDRKFWIAQHMTKCGLRLLEYLDEYEQETNTQEGTTEEY